MTRRCTLGLWLAFGLLLTPGRAAGAPTQVFDNPSKICLRETQLQERLQGLPAHLLTAISRAESGRWDEVRQANVAWPWTVTAGGEGRFFPTRAEALAEVRRLQARGVTNIDVGCMQINLFHHGHQFASVEQAMDPAANAAYAARFLKSLYAATGDWTQAAAHYHSTTPERSEYYKAKVVRLWDATKRENPVAIAPPLSIARAPNGGVLPMVTPRGVPSFDGAREARDMRPLRNLNTYVAPIDGERTAFLNARFRASRTAATAAKSAGVRAQQLTSWRQATAGDNTVAVDATIRRAALEAERRRQLQSTGAAKAATQQARFAVKRAQQLERWRLSQTVQPEPPPALDDGKS
jgi:hypothetical protein